MKVRLFAALILMSLVMGCSFGKNSKNKTGFVPKNEMVVSVMMETARPTRVLLAPEAETANNIVPTAAPTTNQPLASETTLTPAQIGPESYPPDVNPLTGLPVENPENLLLPPALVSITNFPISARPQAGLSFAPFVFELYIGEGMTRYLALFYGDFPQAELQTDQGDSGT